MREVVYGRAFYFVRKIIIIQNERSVSIRTRTILHFIHASTCSGKLVVKVESACKITNCYSKGFLLIHRTYDIAVVGIYNILHFRTHRKCNFCSHKVSKIVI